MVDYFGRRGYFGGSLVMGEQGPTLHPELPEVAAYAAQQGLHVRIYPHQPARGWRIPAFAGAMARAGLKLVHVSRAILVRPRSRPACAGSQGTLALGLRGDLIRGPLVDSGH